MIHHDLQQGGMNALRFNEYLVDVAAQLPNDGWHCVFIFDNAPALAHAQQAGLPNNISLRYLPPYSPMLNVVEQCFSQWKAALKRDCADVRDQVNRQARTCSTHGNIKPVGHPKCWYYHTSKCPGLLSSFTRSFASMYAIAGHFDVNS